MTWASPSTDSASREDPAEFADAVLDAVTEQFGVSVSTVVVRSNPIHHTTSGKVRRGHMRVVVRRLGGEVDVTVRMVTCTCS